MASNPDLEARILANPDDREAFAVYGDWLSERGDPRGELVAVQIKLEDAPTAELRARNATLLAEHARTWLGELAGLDAKDFAVGWRFGFVASARIGPPLDDYATSEIDFAGTLGTLVELPGMTFLRTLVVGAKDYDDHPTSWFDSVEAIAEHAMPAGLARLEFRRGGFWDISSTELGDLSRAYPRLARLRELVVELGAMELGAIDLPELRVLELETGGLTRENVASIRTGHLPRLESLLLCLGETGGDHGCTVEVHDLGWIFAAEGIAGVRHLGLANSSLADDIAVALPNSKVLGQLATLDLSRGTMTDAGARVILDHAGAFAHLAKLDLSRNFFSAAIADELQALPNVVLAENQGDSDDYRYVAISE